MPTAFTIEHEGRRIELVPQSAWKGDRVRLLVDGRQVAEAKPAGASTVVEGEGAGRTGGDPVARQRASSAPSLFPARVSRWRWIPRLAPSIDLPEPPAIDLPDLPEPPLPSIELPGWLKDVLRTKQYWLPVLIGVAIALNEWRRRRARAHAEPARDAERNVDG
jgi:hypothetical protein